MFGRGYEGEDSGVEVKGNSVSQQKDFIRTGYYDYILFLARFCLQLI